MNTQIIDTNNQNDLESVKKVADESFSTTPDASLEEWFSFEEMVKVINEDRGMCLLAVDDSEKPIGIIYAQQESPINGPESKIKWMINMMAVIPEATGKGIGSELLKRMESLAKPKGVIKMFVFTNKGDDRVINFYKKNGYEDAGWIRDYQYGKGNSAVFLLKYI